jgi:hypothetical protein
MKSFDLVAVAWIVVVASFVQGLALAAVAVVLLRMKGMEPGRPHGCGRSGCRPDAGSDGVVRFPAAGGARLRVHHTEKD